MYYVWLDSNEIKECRKCFLYQIVLRSFVAFYFKSQFFGKNPVKYTGRGEAVVISTSDLGNRQLNVVCDGKLV